MMRQTLRLGLLLVLAAALFGCGSGNDKSGQAVQKDDYAGPPSGGQQAKSPGG